MNPAIETRRSQAAREAFEEPRRGEVLRTLTTFEIQEKAKQLGANLNERERLDADRKAYVKATGEKIKQLDHQVDTLADEVEYGLAWVPAQGQFEGLFGDHGLVQDLTPEPEPEPEPEVNSEVKLAKPAKRKRKK